MLKRAIRHFGATTAVTIAMLYATSPSASADGLNGPSGGAYETSSGGIVVSAGVPGSPGTSVPGGPGTPGGGGAPSPFECISTSTTDNSGAQETVLMCCPAGNEELGMGNCQQVQVTPPAPPPPPPPPDPGTVAAQAESQISLPSPVLEKNPSSFGVVNFPEWFWVDASIWHPVSTTATACNAGGCVSATATATPSSLYINTGDGSGITCNGPGTAYDTSLPETSQSTDCSHTYTISSYGQPSPDGNPNDDAFSLSATITWTVTWVASGAASGSGSLGNLSSTGRASLRVEQIESVISGG